jgi:hypothetical protein
MSGDYYLDISGTTTANAFVTDDNPHRCTGALESWIPSFGGVAFGPSVAVSGTVSIATGGAVWTARPARPESGDLELVFRRSGDDTIEGTIRGELKDLLDVAIGVTPRRVAIVAAGTNGSPAFTANRVVEGLPWFSGTVAGSVIFTANDGTTVSCSGANLMLIGDPGR